MKVILAIVARSDRGDSPRQQRTVVREAVQRAHELIGSCFPARDDDVVAHEWFSPQGTSASIEWTNEGESDLRPTRARRVDRSLYVGGYSSRGLDCGALLDSPDLLAQTRTMPGCFSVVRVAEGRLEGVTDATRSNNLFIAETDSLRILASRALLAKLVAASVTQGTSRPRVDYDYIGLRHLAVTGYLLGNRTPFSGVQALEEASVVELTSAGVARRARRIEPDLIIGDSDWRASVERTAGLLVGAFDVIPPGRLELSLTGGRDSRILAAALAHRSEFEVASGTSGRPDDPDVLVAQMIAQRLGFPHRVAPPGGVVGEGEVWAEEPLSRIVRVLDIHDGMTSAWDDFADYPPYRPISAMSGVGGEVLRGGLVWPELDELTADHVRRRLRNVFIGGPFIDSGLRASAAEDAGQLFEVVETDHFRAADDFYRIHRNGRWVAARRCAARLSRDIVDPLLDNCLVQSVMQIDPRQRWEERLVFDVITHLAPQIRDIPVEGHRWRFERDKPRDTADEGEVSTWARRHALQRGAEVKSYLWQNLQDVRIRERVVQLVMDGLEGPAGALFDRAQLINYLQGPIQPPAGALWNLATAVVTVSVPWFRTSRPPLVRPVRVVM